MIPVTISIDGGGNIQLSLDGSFQSPLGVFSIGVGHTFSNANGTLTVRVNGQDTVYDLNGRENLSVHLDSGYYRQINLEKNGKDWLFEAERIADSGSNGYLNNQGGQDSYSNNQSGQNSTPIFDHTAQTEDYSNNQLIIHDDIYFRDMGGDADFIEYELQSVVPDISGIEVQNDTIDASSNQQKSGTYQTITWRCGSNNKTYTVTLQAHIVDQTGNQSVPFEVVFRCH